MADQMLPHVCMVFASLMHTQSEFVQAENRHDDIYVWVGSDLWIHEDISDDDGLFRFYRHAEGPTMTLTFPYPQ